MPRFSSRADLALSGVARFWFVVALLGQWMLAVYVLAFYGRAAIDQDLARWNKVLAVGYVPGDSPGNVALALHLLFAAAITVGGPLQLIPQLRLRLPALHRWSGRFYLLIAVVMSLTGLYLILLRGGVAGDATQHSGTSLNALLILCCAAFTLRAALVRNFAQHRRWALRLFLVVSGVWFFRVGLFFWLIVNQGPVGFSPKTFTGPFLSFLAFAQYLVPLAVLEIYLRTQDRAAATGKFAMAGILFLLTLAMGVGIAGAAAGLWLPRI